MASACQARAHAGRMARLSQDREAILFLATVLQPGGVSKAMGTGFAIPVTLQCISVVQNPAGSRAWHSIQSERLVQTAHRWATTYHQRRGQPRLAPACARSEKSVSRIPSFGPVMGWTCRNRIDRSRAQAPDASARRRMILFSRNYSSPEHSSS